MSANDWRNGDTISVQQSNRPYFMVSGGVNVSDSHVTLYLSQGRTRYPFKTRTLYSGGFKHPPYAINALQPNIDYTVFMRSDATLYVSGAALGTVPPPMHNDEEYIGTFRFNGSVDAAHLIGPWNVGPDFNHLEQRGEMAAITSSLARMYYYESASMPTGSFPVTGLTVTATGIGWIGVTEATGSSYLPTNSLLVASIRWMPSGQTVGGPYLLPSGILRIAPQFFIGPTDVALNSFAKGYEMREFLAPQDPDARGGLSSNINTVVAGYSDGTAAGFVLALVYNGVLTTPGASIRITDVDFAVIPRLVNPPTSTKRNEPA